VLGRPEKRTILSRTFAYHGVNAYGTSLGGIPANAAVFGPLVPEVEQVAWDDAEALAVAIDRLGADKVAAFVCEPVVGAGGVMPPPDGYLGRVEEICRERDVLLIADEVITGFGRLGEWFGSERFHIRPDFVTVAKGITSGYAPLGAAIASGRVAQPFFEDTNELLRHGYTYSGHAAACAVALANLDVIEAEELVERVRTLEPVLESVLRPLEAHELVGEVRTIGLLAGVEVNGDLADRVAEEAFKRGVIVRVLRGTVLQISPPFVISEEQLGTIASVLEESLVAA
jgi:putrescine aminotransferase